MRKKVIWFLVLVLLVSGVYAQYDYTNPGLWDENVYEDKESYASGDFYKNSDPLQWNPDLVAWSNPGVWENQNIDKIFDKPPLYDSSNFIDFMNNFPSEKANRIKYDLISEGSYKDLRFPHDKVDPEKYISDLKCIDCEISIGDYDENFEVIDVKVTYSKEGITHSNGDFVSIPGTYPPKVIFYVFLYRIVVRFPEGAKEINVPHEDDVTVDTSGGSLFYKENNLVRGKLSFKDGEAYVREKDEATINSVQVDNAKSKVGVNIYFDGERHEGAAVSMDLEKKKMYFGKGLESKSDYELSFEAGNPFLDTEENDYLTMKPGYNSEITIQHRGEELVPLVAVKEGKHGIDLLVTNGKQRYLVTDGSKLKYKGILIAGGEQGSVPFTMFLQDKEGNNLLGTEKEKEKIIFDNAQNHIIFPEDLPAEEFECKECTFDLKKSRTLYDFASAQILKSGNIEKITADNAIALYRLSGMLEKLHLDVRDSVLEIEIVPDDQVPEKCGSKSVTVGGCANHQTRRIIVGEDVLASTFYHEGSHTLHFEIEQKGKLEAEKEMKKYELELRRKYGMKTARFEAYTIKFLRDEEGNVVREPDGAAIVIECKGVDLDCFGGGLVDADFNLIQISKKEKLKWMELRVQANKQLEESFNNKWEAITGENVYGKELKERTEGLPVQWADGSSGPRRGCMRAYGCNNVYEDVATFIEPIARGDHGFYKPLITPGDAKYNPSYRKKIDLLHEYGFISDEDYKKAVGE